MPKKKDNGYKKVKDGVYLHPKFGRVMEHKGYATRIFWSKQMIDYLRRHFATTTNEELAGWLGVSERTMIRKARQLGLKKNPEWQSNLSRQHCKLAHAAALKAGNPGRFKKGVRANPDGEFKPGHKESPEQREKRIAGMVRYYRTHPAAVKAARQKSWATRRLRQYIANPEGAKAGERYQNFDVEGFPSESIKAPM